MRVGPHLRHTIMMLETWIGASISEMPPRSVCLRFFMAFLTMLTPATMARPFSRSILTILPCLPLSLPAMTWTWSSLRSLYFISAISLDSSQDLGREGDDLHVVPLAELAGHRPEDALALRVLVRVDDDAGVVVETDIRSVRPAILLRDADYDRLLHGAFLDGAGGKGVLDRHGDDIADAGVSPPGAAEHLDALDPFRPGVVGDVQHRF